MKLIDAELLNRTSAQARTDDRLRKNYNFHERPDDPVNRLLNALEPGSYLPAHRHLNPAKDEAIVVLRGSVASFIFDDRGRNCRMCRDRPAARRLRIRYSGRRVA